MGKVIELLECAKDNRKTGGIGNIIAKAQELQYNELIQAGAIDEDDVDEALELYPECKLKPVFN